MPRVTKNYKDRKKEIVDTATRLFTTIGYENTTIERIIEEMSVAKGTFYYYFPSKEAILESVANNILDDLINNAQGLANNTQISISQKLEMIFSPTNNSNKTAQEITETLHHTENSKLHQKINVNLVLRLSPILVEIIEQGINENLFEVEKPLETVQFLLVGAQFLFKEQLFSWDKDEYKQRRLAMKQILERSLGSEEDFFKFLL
ncbi:TetR/AcrR family transcriptional regulator [Candidatus Dojkabacteria bacterium]|uniref:TetR/AcrR family transcriptional regulator n=1 Tax=Candidatus Dojkabacteria bacterium TaxID=2099670 RepID=A0A955RJI2_9BACT|nr:TetR/AcrR family transcriptional regulator [Candidatus Dojkabacteria bacterium]